MARFRRPVHCARFERPQRQPTVRRTSHRGDRTARRRKAIPSSRAAVPTGPTDSTRQESSRPSNGQNAIDLCPFRHSTQSVAAREPTAACPGNPRSALLVSARGRTAPGTGGSVSAVPPGENMLSLPSGRFAARSHRACGQPPQSEPRRCPSPGLRSPTAPFARDPSRPGRVAMPRPPRMLNHRRTHQPVARRPPQRLSKIGRHVTRRGTYAGEGVSGS